MKYLDTNVIGYAIESHPKYGNACKKILQDVQDGTLKVAASLLVLCEILGVLRKINKELDKLGKTHLDVRASIDAILSIPIVWIENEPFIVKRAAEYTFSIPGADHIHLASMEVNGIREIISADGDFDKTDVRRIDPLEY